MGYVLLLLATLAWSFVGVLVKSASAMVDNSLITFSRFFFGVVFLGIFILIKEKRLRPRFSLKWIWIGAAGKGANYIFENLAITLGYAYGNILVQPVQTAALLIAAGLLFKEPVSRQGWSAAALCMLGVLVIGWNGLPARELLSGSGLTTLLFTFAGIGAAIHVLSQRILLKSMDSGNMNLSVFMVSTLLVALPIPFEPHQITGPVTVWGITTLVVLGVITGLSFLWFAEAIKRVSFAVVAVVGNSSVLFSILWSYLFFHEPITGYVLTGTFIFLAGFVLLNVPYGKKTAKPAS
ncbi:DMT family transporter [Paenibacillus hodogayensis]|uniref:DMT family transporter n=1 Tax=Paenibacillus hodogayensis TaxID=279208 RepID=A0ABV5W8J2_9BACL